MAQVKPSRRYATTLLLITLTISMLAITPSHCEKDYALVDSKPRLPLIIDGNEVANLPARAPPNSEVCVPKTTVYVDVDRRYVFERWSNGEASKCIRVRANETVTAYYIEEVLIQIYSEVKEYSKSFWVKVGELVRLSVDPIHYVGQDTRYVFKEWSGGETPFSPENVIVAVRPVRLEIKWFKEYLLTLVSISKMKLNGSGWYREGSLAVISAPEEVDSGDGKRLVFDRWGSVGLHPVIISNPSSPIIGLVVNGPYQVMPIYSELFLVEVYGLGGSLVDRKWVEKGGIYKVEVKNIIEIVPGEVRYVFRGWRDPDIPPTPSLNLEVDKPLRLEALYEKQYYVKVYSDYGSVGEGWYPENSTSIVRVPETPQTVLFIKRVLSGWGGDIDKADIRGGEAIIRSIKHPVKLSAIYGIEVDYLTLAIFCGAITTLFFIGLRKGKKRAEEIKVVEAGQEEVLGARV